MKDTKGADGRERAGLPTMASYGMGKFLAEFLTGGFAALVFKYYETELGLSAGLVAAGVIVYSLWNAVNDPLIGYLTARPTPWAARLGRRFPWIAAGTVLCALSFVLIFAPPASLAGGTHPGLLFGWLVFSVCLYDGLYSVWELNYQSVFPDRFRDTAERAKAAGIATLVGVLGIAGGAILPTLVIRYGDPASYTANGWIFAAAALVSAFLLLPGVRETPSMIRRYLEQTARKTEEQGFFARLREALKDRDFLAFILLFFFYQSATISMTASIHYVGDYVLGGRSTTFIFAGMLIGALASVPIWTILLRRRGDVQGLLQAAALVLAVFCLPLLAARTYGAFVAAMFFWGTAFGGFWLLIGPALADVVDGIVVRTGKREEGVYLGFRAFAGRLSYAVQALSFWAVHAATGFSRNPRSPAAVTGIRVHTALLPALFLVAGVLVFRSLNTLSKDKAESNRTALRERGL